MFQIPLYNIYKAGSLKLTLINYFKETLMNYILLYTPSSSDPSFLASNTEEQTLQATLSTVQNMSTTGFTHRKNVTAPTGSPTAAKTELMAITSAPGTLGTVSKISRVEKIRLRKNSPSIGALQTLAIIIAGRITTKQDPTW